jgi:hypothetical protein
MKRLSFIFLTLLAIAPAAFAQTTRPSIALTTDVEDGKKMLHAVVTFAGKPKENVILEYFVRRTFGSLQIGQDTTLDDGTSAVVFPTDLPAGADGNLLVSVRIKSPAPLAGTTISVPFPADQKAATASDAFPRALWAPHAPLGLVVSILALLAGVWVSYAFVATRILAIRTGGKP